MSKVDQTGSFISLGNFEPQVRIPPITFEDSITQISGEEKKMFISFVKRMLTWEPKHRSTAKDLLDDPWLRVGSTKS